MEKFGFGKKKSPQEENVIVDASLKSESFSPEERLEEMGNAFAKQSEDWNARLEKMESDIAQGEQVSDADYQAVKDRAGLYSKLEGAVRTGENAGGGGPAMVRAAIAYLEQYAPQSSDYERGEMERTIQRLRELI